MSTENGIHYIKPKTESEKHYGRLEAAGIDTEEMRMRISLKEAEKISKENYLNFKMRMN